MSKETYQHTYNLKFTVNSNEADASDVNGHMLGFGCRKAMQSIPSKGAFKVIGPPVESKILPTFRNFMVSVDASILVPVNAHTIEEAKDKVTNMDPQEYSVALTNAAEVGCFIEKGDPV